MRLWVYLDNGKVSTYGHSKIDTKDIIKTNLDRILGNVEYLDTILIDSIVDKAKQSSIYKECKQRKVALAVEGKAILEGEAYVTVDVDLIDDDGKEVPPTHTDMIPWN